MEHPHLNGIEPSKDQHTPIGDRSREISNDHLHDPTAGVTYERLHTVVPDLVLPATFLAVTLLGIIFVLLILIIWLKTHLSCSSKKSYDKNISEGHNLVHIMEPDGSNNQFKIIIENADMNDEIAKKEIDDFKFKLPSILNDSVDFKYIDELDGARNISPPILKINNNGGSSPKLPEPDEDENKQQTDSNNVQGVNISTKSKNTDVKFVFPNEAVNCSTGNENKVGKYKVALTDQQWIMHRKPPLNWRGYNINVPKAFGFVGVDNFSDTSSGEGTSKRYSVTRSPSLEKDEKSPSYFSVTDSSEYVADKGALEKSSSVVFRSGNTSPVVEVRVQPLPTDSHVIFDDKIDVNNSKLKSVTSCDSQQLFDNKISSQENSIIRRCGAANIGLRICTVNENVNTNFQCEKIEMQNSPRYIDSLTDKENNPSPRFSFSPKFFTSPDNKSPKFFGSPSQKSPNYCIESQNKSMSPKAIEPEKSSPKFFHNSQKSTYSSLLSNNGNNYVFAYNKDYSYEENTCNNNYKLDVSLNDSKNESNMESQISVNINQPKFITDNYFDNLPNCAFINLDTNVNVDVNDEKVKRCDERTIINIDNDLTASVNSELIQSSNIDPNFKITGKSLDNLEENINLTNEEEIQDYSLFSHTGTNSSNYRRQRLKSISLDSDNAKFIEQNLGLPVVKHLKQEHLFNSYDGEKLMSTENNQYINSDLSTSAIIKSDRTYFNFSVDPNDQYNVYINSNENFDSYEKPGIHNSPPECIVTFTNTSENKTNFLKNNSPIIAFNEVEPRFSPKEFDNKIDSGNNTCKSNKNKRNLTIDLSKHDVDLEKELSDFSNLDSELEKKMTPKTPTLKVKATSLDSSETLNLSLPQSNTLQVPQNSISVPNTPKRQLKRTLTHKMGKLVKASHYITGNYGSNLNEIFPRICSDNQQNRKIYMNVKCPSNFIDSGIFLRENHANLMLFQASKYSVSRGINNNSSTFSRRMGSFDENMVDAMSGHQIVPQLLDNRLTLPQKTCDVNLLGSNLLSFKQNLSVSSTNLKTLPEGVPSMDFEIQPEGKPTKKTLLQRRGSNQSLTINLENSGSNFKYSTLSLQGSNLSLASFSTSNHNLTNIKNSASNFSLNTDNRQKKNILERRNSNTSLTLNLDYLSQPTSRLYSNSNCNLQCGSQYNLTNQDGQTKKCLLQRRGSNTSLTLNLQNSSSNLNRCTSNSSLNIHNETKGIPKKGLLERRSSNTSLTLNINAAGTHFDSNRVLSVSNYNLDGTGSGLSRYNSNQSINISGENYKKGLLERRSSNTSLVLNINNLNFNMPNVDTPRDIEIDDVVLQSNLKSFEGNSHINQREKHRKSLSTENLFSKFCIPKSLQSKNNSMYSFGSHDNIWSNYCAIDPIENIESSEQNLTYICGDQDNEIIYAFGDRQQIENVEFQTSVPVKNITTKPLSPHSTSEDFKLYLANIQHLQNASNILSRDQLKDLNSVFQEGYTKAECSLVIENINNKSMNILSSQIKKISLDHSKSSDVINEGKYNPQRLLPDPVFTYSEYQKTLLRNLHQEFWDLPTNFQEKPMVFGSHPKNRYKTILPNEHSRVILRAEPGESDEGYINANYIKGHEYTKNSYIATQGPLQNTIYDFWLMVYQNRCDFHRDGCTKTNEERHFGSPHAKNKSDNISSRRLSDDKKISIQKIIMLTNLLENGRQKCEKYFPVNLNEEIIFKQVKNSSYSACGVVSTNTSFNNTVTDINNDINMFKIRNIGIINKTGYTIRKLYVEYKNKHLKKDFENTSISNKIISDKYRISVIDSDNTDKNKTDHTDHLIVYHYWFDNWADHKCPKDVSALLNLSLDVLQNKIITFDTSKDYGISEGNIDVCKEKRLTAFQSAKAFFDEFSKINLQDDYTKIKSGRKNSLASKLDLPKPKQEALRRESTGAIDSIKITTSKPLHFKNKSSSNENNENLKTKKEEIIMEMPPIIVHCSAGIGRTGCLIAVLNGIKQLKTDDKVDILGVVCNMRLNRGGMVQNSEQYELIHKVLCLYDELGLPNYE